VEPHVLDLAGPLISTGLELNNEPCSNFGKAVGPASGESSFGGGVGDCSPMLEHDEFLVIVAFELLPEECTDEEPVESLRFGRIVLFFDMIAAFCGCLELDVVVGAKAGQAKSCAPVVEAFTKVLEAPSLCRLSLLSRPAKRSNSPTKEPVSKRDICGSSTDDTVTLRSSPGLRKTTGSASDLSLAFMTRFSLD
jgi:hypothetical protein